MTKTESSCNATRTPMPEVDEAAQYSCNVVRFIDPIAPADGLAWFEDGDFVRLREVALSWSVPASLGRKIGARAATVAVAGRNLAMWSDYSGLDPEVSWYGQSTQLQQDLFTLPLARTVSVRIDVRW